jgi:hypothetical protein
MVTHTGTYWHLQLALKAHERSFAALEQEMDAFQALPIEDFGSQAEVMWSNMRPINPDKSDSELRGFIDEQIALRSSAEWQRINRFSEPFVSERVSITVLSHAFAEALINAILVIGLESTKKRDLFVLLEQANVKDKWTLGPPKLSTRICFRKVGSAFQRPHRSLQAKKLVHSL